MVKVISLTRHEYAGKMREADDEYDAEDDLVEKFLIPLKRVRVMVPKNRALEAEEPKRKRGRPRKQSYSVKA
jgi:hypothetical protein